MKKAVFAAALLLLLLLLSMWNLHRIDALTDSLEQRAESVQRLWRAGDFDTAATVLEGAVDTWCAADGYTHIFIRHAEIDAASDAFYELLGHVYSEDAPAAEAGLQKLLYHLDSIDSMEHVTFKSVF